MVARFFCAWIFHDPLEAGLEADGQAMLDPIII